MKYMISALCIGFALSLTPAFAETATTPATTTPPATTTKAPAKPRSAKSLECSKLADTKGLHGKERKTFRKKCIKGEPTT